MDRMVEIFITNTFKHYKSTLDGLDCKKLERNFIAF